MNGYLSAMRTLKPSKKVGTALGFAMVVACTLAPSASWANVRCSDEAVRAAFDKALDKLYAESRTLAKVDVEITDTIVVDEFENKAVCKALGNVTVEFLGKKDTSEVVLHYVAELTSKGSIFVTIHE